MGYAEVMQILNAYYTQGMQFLDGYLYLKAMVIFLLFFIAAKIFYWVIVKIFMRIAKKTETEADDQIVEFIRKPVTLIIVMFGVFFALKVFALGAGTLDKINKGIYSLIVVIITYIVIVVVDILISEWGHKWAKQTDTSLDDALLPLFHKISKVLWAVLGFLYILLVWDVQIGPFLASLGIAGLALGLALQDTLKNIFGGMSLLMDKAYSTGDVVEFEGGTTGTVRDIGLRSTKVETFDGLMVAIPNGAIANQRVLNRVLPSRRARVDVKFGVAYGTDYKDVKKYIIPIIKEEFKEILLKDKDIVIEFLDMGASSLNFVSKFWIKNVSDRWDSQRRATEIIYDELNNKNIAIPFPQMDVHLHHAKAEKKKLAKRKKR